MEEIYRFETQLRWIVTGKGEITMRWLVILSVGLIGFLIGAYVLATPELERSLADTFTPMVIIASLLFGGVAVFLLDKKSDNPVIVTFSVTVLSTLFGLFVGPLG